MKKFRPIIIVIACVALCGGSFFLYVNGLKNPTYLEPSQEELLFFQQVKDQRYPQLIVDSLPYPVTPAEFSVHSGSAILIDAATGSILYEKNADAVIPPASMTKLVVMYVVFQEIATGRISLDDVVPLPPESWAVNAPPQSSLMFLAEGQTVTLRELLLGLAVASGNDAAVAVAHYVSGSVDKFIERMNREMEILGLEKTRFVEPSGYSELNLTTPREFAAFARVYLARYPESLEAFHSQPSISYPQEHNLAEWHQDKDQAIFQQSTNKLLGVLPGCDGLKTGFIYESGYNLSLTAQRGETRFISVTMKGPGVGSVEGNRYRVADGTNLMEWAFSTFATHFKADVDPLAIPVLGGHKNSVVLAPLHTNDLTVPAILKDQSPAAAANSITAQISIPSYVQAPLQAGDVVGKITYSLGNIVLEEVPLLAVTPVEDGNVFKKLVDKLAVGLF
ncbi:MAG: D-alanyl-D-alanine carboxypeptidase family protein [Treponema sp.]|nr:D-alanyl-D-alanine carboxypeptidase family protein [Treponema sp.]